MNMLIIGNGFDLAHNRPTKYEDFLKFTQQIIRAKNYHGARNQFEETMPKLHPGVKRYILSVFDTRKNNANNEVNNNREVIEELYDKLNENVWHDYFQFIVEKDKIRGKGWIDFESEIREIIQFFDKIINDLYETIPKTISNLSDNDKVRFFWSKLKFLNYNKLKGYSADHDNTYSDFIEKTYQDLVSLIRCLEIYLDDCVVKEPVTCYSQSIQELKINSILSFNYTAIPTDVYPALSKIRLHQIHGFAKADRPSKDNNMILGVNEYWDDDDKNTHTNFNLYKKFVQRIIKETGVYYKWDLEKIKSTYYREKSYLETKRTKNSSDERPPSVLYKNYFYIFGHSLDTTDGDILSEILQTPGVITTIFYRDKQQQAKQMENLSKVLGQSKLLESTFSIFPTIIFKKQSEMIDMHLQTD